MYLFLKQMEIQRKFFHIRRLRLCGRARLRIDIQLIIGRRESKGIKGFSEILLAMPDKSSFLTKAYI